MSAEPVILLTGATGYVGGRLLRALEASGRRVRCMARRPENLRAWVGPGTEIVRGDCLECASLDGALAGVESAYYLVHSMGAGADFEERDRRCARHFGEAARAAGVKRIFYLGGLGDGGAELSAHLRSRQETGEVLRAASGLPVIELRASIVLGTGSLSFELIRSLVERLPVMLCPRWVETEAQPIAIDDLVAYLLAALDLPAESRILEVGGADRVSYGDIMREYARQRGLRRVMIPVPVLTPRLSSLWLGLTTPLYARVGRKLIEGVRNPTVVRDGAARRAFPSIRPIGLREAIARAMANEDRTLARWSAALSSSGIDSKVSGGRHFGPRLIDSRALRVAATPEQAFAPIREIGGERGWYYADFLWRLRGFLDLLAGGVGMRRGRRDPESLVVGDALDFWRVEAYEPDRRLRLAAEMRLPGRAWLEFEVRRSGGETVICQTAEFDPVGVAGRLYWYGIYPLHALVFRGMLRGIAARAAAHPSAAASAPGRR
ncbi:MAG: SDR family oxidoreductase [Deltaproteobacteria bacterium]|nr:SDR family oxidoreductase [Deltaproteobacteria bacterium]